MYETVIRSSLYCMLLWIYVIDILSDLIYDYNYYNNIADVINTPLIDMPPQPKVQFYALFIKYAHSHVPILMCTNFACHLVTKNIFHVLISHHLALVIFL